MTLMEAVIPGFVRGLTKPLPVGSSTHPVIVPALVQRFQERPCNQ
jgi:undecaprenyl pyrophosphate phosphatase UppP